MDNTWEIMCVIGHYCDKVNGLDLWSHEYADVQKLYAQAIRLQCQDSCGLVMTTDDFIDAVADGSFINYDGFGQFADYDGTRHEYVDCHTGWLKKHRGDYPFVFWYNK